MNSNLIQNFITYQSTSANRLNQQKKQEAPKKPKPDFDIQKELNNRTFIKPLDGKGQLIKGSIFNSPAALVKNGIYNAKALKHAIQGNANDHELGKLNDLGLMLGGLGIAGYLFTKRQTPMTKGMEFVGLASFLASMAIWPKIAIQLPAYLIHGVNVHKQYEDSFGRKKPFYQDPQFLPWDLYSDEEIQKIGDRLGVDKNIPNRREFIQEKMKKIATQNNTLWMLTAGFAAPIMSGIICNLSEPYLNKFLDNRQNKEADKILSNIDSYAKKYQTNFITNNLNEVITKHKDQPVTKELEESISEIFTKYMDPLTARNFRADLREKIYGQNTYNVKVENIKEIHENLLKMFKKVRAFDEEFIQAIIPNENQIIELLNSNEQLNKDIDASKFRDITIAIKKLVEKNAVEYNKNNPDKQQDIELVRKLIVKNKADKNSSSIKVILSKAKSNIFDSKAITKLQKLAKIFDDFNAKNQALDEYALKKVGAAPETVIANYWNDVAKTLLKSLGFTSSELEKVHSDTTLISPLLRKKVDNIVANKESFNKLMTTMAKKIAEINDKLKTSDISTPLMTGDYNNTAYDDIVDGLFDSVAKELRNGDLGFERTAKGLVGVDGNDVIGTLKNLQKIYVKDRLLGVKSSFYRIINTLDMFRRISTDVNNQPALQGKYTEVKEELIELCKTITLEGHSSDYATKFYMLRNAHPNTTKAPVEVKNGKVVYHYLNKNIERTDIPGDKYFYQDAMRLMYEGDMHPDTMAILNETNIKQEVLNYRNTVLEKLGGEDYFAKPRHLIRAKNQTGSDVKFLLTGISPLELLHKTGKQVYNTNKWLKIFGGAGAALLGLTVFVQFFLGKMKSPQQKGK